MELVQRFLKYVSYDTQSSETSSSAPSTAKQKVLAKVLAQDLKDLGLTHVKVSRYGVVYGTLKANTSKKSPVIGLIAHMDTALEMPGANVKARLVKNYDGKAIILNKEKNIVMDPEHFETLKKNIGEDLIVTDGTTLLGGDDKAGIAIIFATLEHLLAHPEIPHGKIQVAFTPDEEVGRGVEHFDVKGFAADFAYTLDGGDIEAIAYENFNAASAVVQVNGVSVHPGYAKGKMVNAILVAQEFNRLLPAKKIPSLTDGYEGFNHLLGIQGTTVKTEMHYIIRNHDLKKLEAQKKSFLKAAEKLNAKYGENTVIVALKDGYRNMGPLIKKDTRSVDRALDAFKKVGQKVEPHAIRGGTDGATLSYQGLLCPNLPTGGFNAHGPYEYVSVNQMQKMVTILSEIVRVQ